RSAFRAASRRGCSCCACCRTAPTSPRCAASPASEHRHAAMTDRDVSPALRRVIAFFESLRPEDLPALARIYADDARFRDPFSDVRGHAAIEAIFAAMFVRLDEPRFVITEVIEGSGQAFLAWDFEFR